MIGAFYDLPLMKELYNTTSMAAHTSLFSFDLQSAVDDPARKQSVQEKLRQELEKHRFELQFSSQDLGQEGGFLLLYTTPTGSHATVRGYSRGLITVDIHEYVDQTPVFSPQVAADFEKAIKTSIDAPKSKSHPAIRRGEEVDVYYPTVDGRIIEYDIDRLVYEADSPYQNIKICHAKSFGNMLILDDDPNLAESDVLYSHSMMRHGQNDFTAKDCLILGGGDGGLLNELRKEDPHSVVMVDIDELVLRAAQEHLRGICTDSLDSLRGDNYEVIVGDAISYLRKFAEEGRHFDFILSDLTVVPISPQPIGDEWDFLRLVLDLSLQVLTPDGKYLTHANSALAGRPIELFEAELSRRAGYKWNRIDRFIPSFHELWTFYELERDSKS